MIDSSKAIKELLEGIRKDIIADQQAKNIRTSGKSASSLEIYTRPGGGKLVGASYFQQQVHGRGPGSFPPMEDLIDWVRRKLRPTDISVESLAYLVARKLATKGSDVFIGIRPSLSIKEVIAKNLQSFREQLTETVKANVKTSIRDALQGAADALKDQ